MSPARPFLAAIALLSSACGLSALETDPDEVHVSSAEAELQILETHGDHELLLDIGAVVTADDVRGLTVAAKGVHVAPALKGYLVELAQTSRRHPHLQLGMSPRADARVRRQEKTLRG